MAEDSAQTGLVGVSETQVIFERDFGWVFRRQPEADVGIDAYVEIRDGERLTGKLFALQIKSGKSYLRSQGDDFVLYGRQRHYDYWLNHSLPVYLIIHDPTELKTYWQKFEPQLITRLKKGRWCIGIPRTNVLTPKFRRDFEAGIPSDKASQRRFLLTVDLPTIRKIARARTVRVSLDEFYNKYFRMRGARVYLPNSSRHEADFEFVRWEPTRSIHNFMAEYFPWLDFEYVHGSSQGDEGCTHELSGWVNALGKSLIRVEEYYRLGRKPSDFEIPPLPNDDVDEEEEERAHWDYIINKD